MTYGLPTPSHHISSPAWHVSLHLVFDLILPFHWYIRPPYFPRHVQFVSPRYHNVMPELVNRLSVILCKPAILVVPPMCPLTSITYLNKNSAKIIAESLFSGFYNKIAVNKPYFLVLICCTF